LASILAIILILPQRLAPLHCFGPSFGHKIGHRQKLHLIAIGKDLIDRVAIITAAGVADDGGRINLRRLVGDCFSRQRSRQRGAGETGGDRSMTVSRLRMLAARLSMINSRAKFVMWTTYISHCSPFCDDNIRTSEDLGCSRLGANIWLNRLSKPSGIAARWPHDRGIVEDGHRREAKGVMNGRTLSIRSITPLCFLKGFDFKTFPHGTLDFFSDISKKLAGCLRVFCCANSGSPRRRGRRREIHF